jgi:hypothetical protein
MLNYQLATSSSDRRSTLPTKRFQRNECQGIYAVSLDLKTLTEALAKSSTKYIVTPVWNRKEEIQDAEKLVQAKKGAETKRELIARTQLEAQENLEKTMNAEEKTQKQKLAKQHYNLSSENLQQHTLMASQRKSECPLILAMTGSKALHTLNFRSS